MAKVVRVHEIGGPEVLRIEEQDPGQPGPGQALVRHAAIGLNFIDVYFRTGVYPAPTKPFVPGMEASGVVEAVGEGVSDLRPGQRVAYGSGPIGAYSSARVMPAAQLVPLPDSIPDEQAAAMMLKGLTAQYLLRSTFRVASGHTVLIHAAAGGVGLIACQWAKHLGATVVGTVGSEEKAELARAHGCDHPLLYRSEDWVARAREISGGKGCDVVYDSVGKDTFARSLDCLRPRGLLAAFGQSSGNVPPFDILDLSRKGSLFVTRPTLASYCATRPELLAAAAELFDVVGKGAVRIEVNQRVPLDRVAEAHEALQARRTTGSTVLLP